MKGNGLPHSRDRNILNTLLEKKQAGVYVGIDPTAPSMHVGHLVPMMALYWMYFHGHRACSVVRFSLVILSRIAKLDS